MRRLALAAILALTPAAAASAAEIKGLAIAVAQSADDTALSLPGIKLGGESGEIALLADGQVGSVQWRVRGGANGLSGGPVHAQGRLVELSYNHRLNDAWSYSVGLQQRSWDSSNLRSPLAFFRSQTDLSDPFDTYGRIQGLPMAVVTRLGETINFEAIVSTRFTAPSRAALLNGRQAAVRVSGEPLPRWHSSLIFRQRSGAGPGVGTSNSYATDHIEFHADAYYGPPEARIVHRMFAGGSIGLATTDPFVLISSAPAALHSSVGAVFTPFSGLLLEVDWSHREDGQSQAGWDRYMAAADAHRAALAGPLAGLGLRNLGWDLAAYGGAVRKDQAVVFARAGENLNASLVVSPDGSAIATLNLSYPVTARIGANLGVSAYLGNDHSEFGSLPYKGQATASLSARF